LQLDGDYIILYDELEAAKPVKWTTQFHAPYYKIVAQPTSNANQQNFEVETDLGEVNASVFANSPLKMVVHDQFTEPAVNWAKVTDDEGQIKDFKPQWHAGITSTPAQKFRFLTVIQVKDGKPEVLQTLTNANSIIHLKIGQWEIQAQLDGNQPAALQVTDSQVGSLFNYGALPINIAGKNYKPEIPGSSMLLEMQQGKIIRKEVVDELPDVAKLDYKSQIN